jgi:hypothetical protein
LPIVSTPTAFLICAKIVRVWGVADPPMRIYVSKMSSVVWFFPLNRHRFFR